MQKKITYFAYGSNMNPDQMKTRCPGAEAICPAKLRNYCLAERDLMTLAVHRNRVARSFVVKEKKRVHGWTE